MHHFPKGAGYSALEKNILKRRAFEMVLVLFRVEELRRLVVESIRATDGTRGALRGQTERLPEGTKNLYKKAWQILVDDGVITLAQSREIQGLTDYRNVVAHATELLTTDINRDWSADIDSMPDLAKYKPEALRRIKTLATAVESGMQAKHYVFSISLGPTIFEPAERAYAEEIRRLSSKIHKQMSSMREEIEEVNANIASLPPATTEALEPLHPDNRRGNGTLTKRGIDCCIKLFILGATPIAVAYLMRISVRSSNAQYRRWQSRKIRD